MRLRTLIVVASVALAACTADTPDPVTTGTATETGTATPSATTTPEPAEATEIVYDTQRFLELHAQGGADLWLYTIDADAVTRLTTDREETFETDPVFSPDGAEVYYRVRDFARNRDSIWKLDPSGSSSDAERVIGGTRTIPAFALHPTDGRIAFLRDGDSEGTSTVRVTTPDGGSETVLTLPAYLGRGGAHEDEVRLSWSPDGTMLLVVDTRRNDSEETLFVISDGGRRLIEPRFGTFARWSPDSSTIYYRLWSQPAWFALQVDTDTQTPLPITRRSFNPDVSPDGSHLVYDDGRARPRVWLLDLETGTEERIHAGVAPLWIADDRLVASLAEPCADRFEGEEADRCGLAPLWYPTGEAVSFSIDGSGTSELTLPHTVGADVLFP